MWPIWVLSAAGGPHVGPMNLAIGVCISRNVHTYDLRLSKQGLLGFIGYSADILMLICVILLISTDIAVFVVCVILLFLCVCKLGYSGMTCRQIRRLKSDVNTLHAYMFYGL